MTGAAARNPNIADSDVRFAGASIPAIRRICHAAGVAVRRIRADYARARYLAGGGAAVKTRFLQRLDAADGARRTDRQGPYWVIVIEAGALAVFPTVTTTA